MAFARRLERYLGPTGLQLTSGVQFYTTGYSGAEEQQRGDEDALIQAASDAGLNVREIPLSGEGADTVLFLEIGEGVQGNLRALLRSPSESIGLSDSLSRLLTRAQGTGYANWRVSDEAAVVACVGYLYDRIRRDAKIYVEDIQVATLALEPSYSVAISRANFIIQLPDINERATHLFRANSELAIEYLGCTEGLTDAANFQLNAAQLASGKHSYRHRTRHEGEDVGRERVLREIFFPEIPCGGVFHEYEFSPNHDAVGRFAGLLHADAREEDLQEFLTEHPSFLIGLCGFADSSEVAFFTKPRIGSQFVADFAILGVGQGGAGISLVEIETSAATLFTKKLTPASRYQTAIGQVTEWKAWIDRNQATFARDMIRATRSVPQWPDRASNGSFRRLAPDRIEHQFWAFSGDTPVVSFSIICGRWAKLEASERERLVFLNKANGYRTYTFDQLARIAFHRPVTDF